MTRMGYKIGNFVKHKLTEAVFVIIGKDAGIDLFNISDYVGVLVYSDEEMDIALGLLYGLDESVLKPIKNVHIYYEDET